MAVRDLRHNFAFEDLSLFFCLSKYFRMHIVRELYTLYAPSLVSIDFILVDFLYSVSSPSRAASFKADS